MRPETNGHAAPDDDGVAAAGGTDAPASGWGRTRQDLAVVLWPSFLAAAAATMFFFAVFDPVAIGEGTALAGILANRNAGYALGFFFFWLLAATSSAVTIFLARTQHPERPTDIAPWLRDKP